MINLATEGRMKVEAGKPEIRETPRPVMRIKKMS